MNTTVQGLGAYQALKFTIYKVPSMDDLEQESCINVQLLSDADKCSFVRQAADCRTESSFVPYLELLFCEFDASSRYMGILTCVLWLVIMFFLLGKSANDFFCPALTVIARVLGLSENLAGVTVLAFGNGSPDIFTSLAGAPRGRSELVFGELVGSGLFVTSVIAGAICTLRPFQLMERPFLRDVIFYLGAAYWTFYIFYKGEVTTWEAIGFIVLYVVYIVFVLAERVLSKPELPAAVLAENKWKPLPESDDSSTTTCSLEGSTRSLPDSPSSNEGVVLPKRARSHTVSTVQELALHHERLQQLWAQGLEEELQRERSKMEDACNHVMQDHECMPLLPGRVHQGPGLWNELKDGIRVPLGLEEGEGWLSRVLTVLQIPVVVALKLLVPVVNYTVPRHAWCRPLNALHCITCPLFCVIATQVSGVRVAPWLPLWLLCVVLGGAVGVLVLVTSSYDRPPRFHDAFAFLGFAGSVVTIYMVANEVVNLLRAIGILSRMSDTMLGMTVLAWGNSIGDFITNFSIARQGFERMGFSACYGGPLFNILLGIGISFTMATIESGEHRIYIHYGEVGPTLAVFLALSLVSSLLAFPLMGFTARRSYGFYLLALYALFLVFAALSEAGLLPFLAATPKSAPERHI